ncbi:MAG: hypothetical protein WBM44_15195 [Waterburya sp.]
MQKRSLCPKKTGDRFNIHVSSLGGTTMINYILNGGAKNCILSLAQPSKDRLNLGGAR